MLILKKFLKGNFFIFFIMWSDVVVLQYVVQGKYTSVNVPLKDGIDDEGMLSLPSSPGK